MIGKNRNAYHEMEQSQPTKQMSGSVRRVDMPLSTETETESYQSSLKDITNGTNIHVPYTFYTTNLTTSFRNALND